MLSEIRQRRTDIICFHSYVDLEKLNRRPWGKGRGKFFSYKQRGREANHKRHLNTENKLGVDGDVGERGKWVMGIEEGTCWDEHWVLYVGDESQESTPKTKSTLYIHCMLANLTINYIKKHTSYEWCHCLLELCISKYITKVFYEHNE